MNETVEAPRAGRLRSIVGAAVVLLLLLLSVAGVKSYRDLAAARSREKLLTERIHQTEESISTLEGEIGRLRDDPATLERLAREELGLVRPGDLVIVLPPGKTGKEAAPSSPAPAAPSPPRPSPPR